MRTTVRNMAMDFRRCFRSNMGDDRSTSWVAWVMAANNSTVRSLYLHLTINWLCLASEHWWLRVDESNVEAQNETIRIASPPESCILQLVKRNWSAALSGIFDTFATISVIELPIAVSWRLAQIENRKSACSAYVFRLANSYVLNVANVVGWLRLWKQTKPLHACIFTMNLFELMLEMFENRSDQKHKCMESDVCNRQAES